MTDVRQSAPSHGRLRGVPAALLGLVLASSLVSTARAQAPGGVAGPTLWLKANDGPDVSSGSVSTWSDRSGNANHVTGTGTQRPAIGTNLINFNPALTFVKAEFDCLYRASSVVGNTATNNKSNVFAVAKSLTASNGSFIWDDQGNANTNYFFVPTLNTNLTYWAAGGTSLASYATPAGSVGTPMLWTAKNGNTDDNFNKVRRNGTQFGSGATQSNQTFIGPTVIGRSDFPNSVLDYSFDGDIGEVVFYRSNLSMAQVDRIESYLAVKYGIHKAGSYASSAATTIWNAAANAAHHNNVAGIGRDDGSALAQKQSRSVNATLQVVIGNGNTIAADNASNGSAFSADQSYLLWGDNAGSVAAWTTTGAPAGRRIVARTWKAQETGTVGSVKVQVADNGGASGLPAETGTVYLLVDGDGAFSAGATEYAMTLNGTNWEANLDLTSGQYFTFATVDPSISGTVFEDVNYGGGAGRSKAASAGVGRSGARVELYTSAGVYSTFTTTDTNGDYSFPGLVAGTYHVRVVNGSVTSSRTGYTAAALPVQTYRTTAATGAAVAVTDFVGGTNPAVADAGNGSAGATFSTTTYVYSAGPSGTAQSVAPVVVSSAHIPGVDFGFSFNAVVNTNNAGQGSLRQLIDNANLLGGDAGLAQAGLVAAKDNAVFMISNGTSVAGLRSANNFFSGGVATISPTSGLPWITSPLVLDARVQPGHAGAPLIELNGSGAGAGVDGLRLDGGASTVGGFVINRFTGNGVQCSSAGGNSVVGNYIGTNAAGTTASANGGNGVLIANNGSNTIGDTVTAGRNVISGNAGDGVYIVGSGTSNNVVKGNYIGTNATGTGPVPNARGVALGDGPDHTTIGGLTAPARNVISGNAQYGIYVTGTNSSATVIVGNYIGTNWLGAAALPNFEGIRLENCTAVTIGGSSEAERNVISGNSNAGVYLAGAGTSGNSIKGNFVGTDAAGTGALGNGFGSTVEGIGIGAGSNNTIGGTSAGEGNRIWFNATAGIALFGGSGNAMLGNSISSNVFSIGIDLHDWGVNLNDGAKDAGQPNRGMDHPVFTSAILSGTTLTVAGYVGSAAGQATFAGARVELFESDGDASGFGEGRTYLGFLTAGASGTFSGAVDVSGKGLVAGDRITSTATDGSNNTSEFGANLIVAAPVPTLTLVGSVAPSGTQPPGTDLTFTTTFTNVGTDAARGVVITKPVPANTDLKVGSVTQALGTTGLTVVVTYSSDGGATWSYSPASGAGGAPAGYDQLATHVRWTFTGDLSQTAPNNSGSTGATVRIR